MTNIGGPFTIERDMNVDGPDGHTISDLVSTRTIAKTICESATKALRVALATHGYHLTDEELADVAREVGNNAAQLVGMMEVDS